MAAKSKDTVSAVTMNYSGQAVTAKCGGCGAHLWTGGGNLLQTSIEICPLCNGENTFYPLKRETDRLAMTAELPVKFVTAAERIKTKEIEVLNLLERKLETLRSDAPANPTRKPWWKI